MSSHCVVDLKLDKSFTLNKEKEERRERKEESKGDRDKGREEGKEEENKYCGKFSGNNSDQDINDQEAQNLEDWARIENVFYNMKKVIEVNIATIPCRREPILHVEVIRKLPTEKSEIEQV